MSGRQGSMNFFSNVDIVDSLNMERLSLNTEFSHSNSSSEASIDSLDFGRLPLSRTKYTKFERYFQRFVELGREVLGRDRSFDPTGQHFRYVDRYLNLRDKIHHWMSKPENGALFINHHSYFYLAHMYTIMSMIEQALVILPAPFHWPGAVPVVGGDTHPYWPDVQIREVFRHFDELIIHGRDLDLEAMPWNCSDDAQMSG